MKQCRKKFKQKVQSSTGKQTESSGYDTEIECDAGGNDKLTSSGHLQRCSMADTQKKRLGSGIYPSILSWPTLMGPYKLWIAIVTALDTIWC